MLPVLLLLACQAVAVIAAPLFNCIGGTVYVVAHADDDLLFQSPDLYTDVKSGACITTVIFSAGDSGTTGTTYADSREVGNQAAYAYMAGQSNTYTEIVGILGGQPVTVRTLVGAPRVQRVYFRLPDGNMDGSGFSTTGYQSLRMLYFGSLSTITNQPKTATFTLGTLKQALAEILVARQPSYVRTLDYMSDYDSGDHADHLTVGRLANEVAGQYSNATVSGYMGYPVQNFAPTMKQSDQSFKNKANSFFKYTPHDVAECQSYALCASAGRGESSWLLRQYVVNSYLAQSSYMGTAQKPVKLPSGENIAHKADVTASSQWPTQPAEAATDGFVRGYPGNSSQEWSSYGEGVGAWIRLDWDDPYNISSIVLYDRPNLQGLPHAFTFVRISAHSHPPPDWMTGGTLTFADNATVSFGALANDGSATLIDLGGSGGSVVTDSIFLYVTSTSSSTGQVGLAEFQVFGKQCKGCKISSNLNNGTTTETSEGSTVGTSSSVDLALSATATASSSAPQQGPEKAIDGYVDGYKEDGTGIYSEEWASYGETTGAWINLTWPAYYMIDSLVLHDRPNSNDWITGGVVKFSDGNSLQVTSLDNKGDATVFNLSSPVNASSLLFTVTSTGPRTSSAGLAEMKAYYSLPQTPVNITSSASNTTTTLPVQGDLEDEDWEDDLALLPGVNATASSLVDGQDPGNAINGDPNGYKEDGSGDAYQEWATNYEGAGAWINLDFPNPIQVSQITLYDRPNSNDEITGGRFSFSNGQLVSVGALLNNGSGTSFSIPNIQTTSIKFTVTSVSSTTYSAGLSEFAVFGKVLNSTDYAGSTGSNSTATPTSNSTSTATASATSSAPTSIYTGDQIQRSLDLAVNATAFASSAAGGQGPEKAIDTYVDGYKESGNGHPYEEWASVYGGAGTTFTLTWPSSVTVDAVVLYDRPNGADQLTSGTLTFDSGNVYQVGSLPNFGTGKAIAINREITKKIVLTVTGVSGTTSSVGLAEFAVYGSNGGNGTSTITSSASGSSATVSGSGAATSTSSVPTSTASAPSSVFTGANIQRSQDLAVNATASASSYALGQGPEKAIDTWVDGYKEAGNGHPYEEWASFNGGAGTTFTLIWPSSVTVDAVVLYDRPNSADQLTSGTLTFDSGNVYQVGSLPNSGTGKAIAINRETTKKIVLTVTGVSSTTSSVGLAEFAVYGPAGGNATSTITSSATASSATASGFLDTTLSGNSSMVSSTMLNTSSTAVSTGSVSLNSSSAYPSSTGLNASSSMPSSTGFNASSSLPSATANVSSILPSVTSVGFNVSSSALVSSTANSSSILPSSTLAPNASSTLDLSSPLSSVTGSTSANLTGSAVSTASAESSSAAVPSSASSGRPSSSGSASSSGSPSGSSSTASSIVSPASSLASSPSSTVSSAASSASTKASSAISSSTPGTRTSTRASSASSTALPSSASSPSVVSSSTVSSTSAAATGLPTAPAQAASVNIARISGVKVTASSFIAKSPPSGANDGKVGGLSALGLGTASQEWVANGVKGEWLELNWPQKYLMRDIVLYDRVNNLQGIASGVLNFTDGTVIKFGALSSSGSHVSLGNGLTVSGVRLTVGAGESFTQNAGLAEIEMYNKPAPSSGLVGSV
ncbi:hypothetical protein JCM11251_000484 [Rhodosporidiobolus azoricus]